MTEKGLNFERIQQSLNESLMTARERERPQSLVDPKEEVFVQVKRQGINFKGFSSHLIKLKRRYIDK